MFRIIVDYYYGKFSYGKLFNLYYKFIVVKCYSYMKRECYSNS